MRKRLALNEPFPGFRRVCCKEAIGNVYQEPGLPEEATWRSDVVTILPPHSIASLTAEKIKAWERHRGWHPA